ncbi:choline-sulfatase [Shimia abyssi]|uniref:Choline-sulfatase n=1 Tax=Shimia abyssi TaxID=1662395 RepID=A0A2P8FJS8_9RHOB|nr:choline-sulfatase [Shimia abyssi]PSL21982.1 choline-sulfatase [Shimia abyssi]
MSGKAPNIVLIMADQLAPHFTGTYGHPLVQTPHMDALSERGTVFDAAYCNSPLCAPSRFSFMAGQQVSKIAAYDNASEFAASIPTFAHYLRIMGYRTCLSGKMHFVGPDQLHGFQDRPVTDIYPADFAWVPDWENADQRIDDWYANMDVVQQAGVAATMFQHDYDDEVAFYARRQIFDYVRDGDDPFCLVASFMHPHDPYVARQEFWDLYDPDDIDLPLHPMRRDDQDPHGRRVMDGIEASKVEPTKDELRNTRHAYYANVSFFDSQIGALVKTLEEAGVMDETVIIVTADHGEMLGERSLWTKMNWFERSARVPMIIAGPGIEAQRIPNCCSLVDMLPTMLDIAASSGTAWPELGQPIDGRSLLPVSQGQTDEVDEVFGEYCAECLSHPLFMIRRGRFKYIHCEVDPPMLFDVVADPEERINLAEDPAHAARLKAFQAEAEERWDSESIRADVIKTQKQRRAVHQAMTAGPLTSWDFNPPRDASQDYVRNHKLWTDVADKTRLPRWSGS